MISFSTKPRQSRPRAAGRVGPAADVAKRPAAPSVAAAKAPGFAEPERDDELVDLEHLTEAAAFRRGWHDSSMELRRGLETQEIPLDTLPDDLRDSFFGKLR
jgi:hypothetical protein